jgi:Tfp pilus assembly protein PilN
MKYKLNLIRTLRIEERNAEIKRVRILMLTAISLGFLVLAAFYAALQVLTMEATLSDERNKLARIEEEYKRYKTTTMIVNKADIELLNKLQSERIFWTKKLAAMAYPLPENYWITQFEFNEDVFRVKGYGYITERQRQLVTIDDYLNMLRADTTFNDNFKQVYLDATKREDEKERERVSFEYSAIAGTQ